MYDDFLFHHTAGGPRVQTSAVPDKVKFEQFVGRIADARKDGRPGCAVNVTMAATVEREPFALLKASYQPSKAINTPTIDGQNAAGSGDIASSLPFNESQIDFQLDNAGHTALEDKFSHGHDEGFSDDERFLMMERYMDDDDFLDEDDDEMAGGCYYRKRW